MYEVSYSELCTSHIIDVSFPLKVFPSQVSCTFLLLILPSITHFLNVRIYAYSFTEAGTKKLEIADDRD